MGKLDLNTIIKTEDGKIYASSFLRGEFDRIPAGLHLSFYALATGPTAIHRKWRSVTLQKTESMAVISAFDTYMRAIVDSTPKKAHREPDYSAITNEKLLQAIKLYFNQFQQA